MSDPVTVVWCELPVTDMKRSVSFYDTVFGWSLEIDESGPNPIAAFGAEGVGGHLYPGTSGQGPTVHLAVPDTVEAASERCTGAGGAVVSPVTEIPPGRFAYATDPDGNSIGLFEAKG